MFLILNRHIFTVPETVAKTEVWIEEGKLLQVPLVTTRYYSLGKIETISRLRHIKVLLTWKTPAMICCMNCTGLVTTTQGTGE